MSFAPSVPLAGPAGWRFLLRTEATQRAAFASGAEVARDVAYFREKIGAVASAADLVADRRLLKVALGAFGLEAEIDKKAFLRKLLEDGTDDPGALANRLTAPGFRKLAAAFGFGDAAGPRTATAGFGATIAAAYESRAFDSALGAASNDMRLAMNFRREAAELSQGGSWYSVIASNPLRQVFEKAYGLPASFGKLDVDRQRDILRDKTAGLFGTSELSAFSDPAAVQKVIDRFLARAQAEAGPSATAPGAAALTLLGGGSGAQGLMSLIASLRQ